MRTHTPIRMPKYSKSERSEDEVREGDSTYLPFPIFDPDLLLGLGHNSPKRRDWLTATPTWCRGCSSEEMSAKNCL